MPSTPSVASVLPERASLTRRLAGAGGGDVAAGGGMRPVVGSATEQGGRPYQEDRYVAVTDLNAFAKSIGRHDALDMAVPRSFFAVYDGHGGSKCSKFLAATLHLNLVSHARFATDPRTALLEAWDQTDEQFCARCVATRRRPSAQPERSGSTAVACLLVGRTLFTCNAGDSAAFLLGRVDGRRRRRGGGKGGEKGGGDGGAAARRLSPLTVAHSTEEPAEVERVRARGAQVVQQTRIGMGSFPWCLCSKQVPVGKPRLQPGGLLVTRSFGDLPAKR
eukprot:g3675.t1